nr:hypothetical protein [uncultured Allomuricauda sp.]
MSLDFEELQKDYDKVFELFVEYPHLIAEIRKLDIKESMPEEDEVLLSIQGLIFESYKLEGEYWLLRQSDEYKRHSQDIEELLTSFIKDKPFVNLTHEQKSLMANRMIEAGKLMSSILKRIGLGDGI